MLPGIIPSVLLVIVGGGISVQIKIMPVVDVQVISRAFLGVCVSGIVCYKIPFCEYTMYCGGAAEVIFSPILSFICRSWYNDEEDCQCQHRFFMQG